MQSILEYVKEGNDLAPTGWNTEVGGEVRWYHVPWMAYGKFRGREYIHGFTNELTSHPSNFEISPVGTTGYETWSVGFYNPISAWSIGQLVGAAGTDTAGQMVSNPAYTDSGALPFRPGSVVAKILFTSATPEDDGTGFLINSPEWMANRHTKINGGVDPNLPLPVEDFDQVDCSRTPQPVRLIQVDVSVVDHRSPTGWVFGTFQYDGRRDGESPWDRLQPVGLQWGNDPDTWPAAPLEASAPVRQSVLADWLVQPMLFEHYGCSPGGQVSAQQLIGRMAGPVDNKQQSCLSCHAMAYTPDVAGNVPNIAPSFLCEPKSKTAPFEATGNPSDNTATAEDWASRDWPAAAQRPTEAQVQNLIFQNRSFEHNPGYPGFEGSQNLDFSLPMQVAYLQYRQFVLSGQPAPCGALE